MSVHTSPCPDSAAIEASVILCAPINNCTLMMRTALARDLRSYSNTFRMHEYNGIVTIYGNDDGCVNNGVVLARCWMTGTHFSYQS